MTMRRLRLNLPFLALAAVLLLATAVASLLFARLMHDHLDPNNHPMEEFTWPVFQVQAEYLRVRRLVVQAALEPSDATREAALQRYEVFISRLQAATSGNVRQHLAQQPDLLDLIDRIVASVEDVDRAVESAGTPAEKFAVLRERLADEAGLIQKMVLTTHLIHTEERGAAESTLQTLVLRLAALFGVVVLVVLTFVGVTWRQFRRLETSRDELMALSRGLELEKERAVLASQAKSIFLANMSHELRTPLNAIIGFADMIALQVLGPMQPPRYAEYAADIHSSGQHLLSLVNDLLDLARIEAGRTVLEPSWLDLRKECLAAVGIFDGEARQCGIALERVDVDPSLQLCADRRALRQILLNLLGNALKFTPPGGEIEIAAEQDGDELRVIVSDTGAGIAQELLEHLMEPFVRGAMQAINGQQSTGLGLSITRRLMELHGGRLELVSEPGRGTRAILVFSAAATRYASDANEATAPRAAA